MTGRAFAGGRTGLSATDQPLNGLNQFNTGVTAQFQTTLVKPLPTGGVGDRIRSPVTSRRARERNQGHLNHSLEPVRADSEGARNPRMEVDLIAAVATLAGADIVLPDLERPGRSREPDQDGRLHRHAVRAPAAPSMPAIHQTHSPGRMTAGRRGVSAPTRAHTTEGVPGRGCERPWSDASRYPEPLAR